MSKGTAAAALFAALLLCSLIACDRQPSVRQTAHTPPSNSATLRTRAFVAFDETTGAVVRRTYSVWDPTPEANLDFEWLPDPSSAGEPVATGRGRLTWRERGASSHDRAAIVSVYVGEMKNGRPDGAGVLRARSGLRYDGEWKHGRYEGQGRLQSADGSNYAGAFRAGLPEGDGTLVQADGETFVGRFVQGKRDGQGRTRLPGGGSYESSWSAGVEDAESRMVRLAQVGAVAAKAVAREPVRISFQTDWSHGGVGYVAENTAHDIEIEPDLLTLMDVWNGRGALSENFLEFDDMNGGVGLEFWPVALDVGIKNTGRSKLEVKRAYIDVQRSEPEPRPLFALWYKPRYYPEGCVDNRYTELLFPNFGWSAPENAKLDFMFAKNARAKLDMRSPLAASVALKAESRQSLLYDVDPDLKRLGIDIENLTATCGSKVDKACHANLKKSGALGRLAEATRVEGGLLKTTVVGKLAYTWTDKAGAVHPAAHAFAMDIWLGIYEGAPVLFSCAEGGTPPEFEPGARLRARFETDRNAYQIALPSQGSVAPGKSMSLLLLLDAPRSSHHRFQLVLETGDGQTVRSRDLSLLFIAPPFSPTKWSAEINLDVHKPE